MKISTEMRDKKNILTVAVFSVMGVPPKFLPDLGRITVPSGGKINEISVISVITEILKTTKNS